MEFINIPSFGEEQSDEGSLEIHIKIQQRNQRKCFTFVENVEKLPLGKLTVKDITSIFKQKFSCGGSVSADNVIKLNGDKREEVKEYLMTKYSLEGSQIKIHGF